MDDQNQSQATNEHEMPSVTSNTAKAPHYHPGITPGIDFIWGSDQDEYTEQPPSSDDHQS